MEDRREENIFKREIPGWVGRRAKEQLLRRSCTALVWRMLMGGMYVVQMLYMLAFPFLKSQNSSNC